MIRTNHRGIYYTISKRTNKKVYYGRYTDLEGKPQKVNLGSSLTVAVEKLKKLRKGVKLEETKSIYGERLGKLLNELTIERVYKDYMTVEGGR